MKPWIVLVHRPSADRRRQLSRSRDSALLLALLDGAHDVSLWRDAPAASAECPIDLRVRMLRSANSSEALEITAADRPGLLARFRALPFELQIVRCEARTVRPRARSLPERLDGAPVSPRRAAELGEECRSARLPGASRAVRGRA
jgi:UTP:GlnB (protein PII) uridylyltransferase